MARLKLSIGEFGEIGKPLRISNGSWQVRVFYGDHSGSTKKLTAVGTTPRKARAKLNTKMERHKYRNSAINDNTLLVDLAKQWIEWHSKKNKPSESTEKGYWRAVNNHLAIDLPKLRLGQVTTGNFEKYLETKTPSIAKQIKIVASGAFRLAIRENMGFNHNPIKEAIHPTYDNGSVKLITLELCREYLDLVKEVHKGTFPLYKACLLLHATGARPEEILALRWTDIDLKNHKISLVGGLNGNNRKPWTKTQSGYRTIKLFHQEALETLANMENYRVAGAEQLFHTKNLRYYSISNLEREIRKVREHATTPELIEFIPYNFRHAMGTFLGNTVGAEEASKYLCHADSDITKKHYIAKQPTMVQELPALKQWQ
ncbi:MAG: tyrosine-type recombinase/integrase [Micrococcaceae bacterium]